MLPALALLPAGPLVQGGKVGIHIAGISAAARHLLARGGNLTQRVGIVGDIRQDDQHVHVLFKREILRGGQRHTGRGDTLDWPGRSPG